MIDTNMDFKVDDVQEQAFRQGYAAGYKDGFTAGREEDLRIRKIANHYGSTQEDIMIEECGELIQAICKLRRGWGEIRLQNFKEELADVLIVARQLRTIFGEADIDQLIDFKLNRQLQRMEEEA